ncbi:MAG: protein-L-isoaspartate O-methyltransferase, partial [Rhodospirillales bacterium]
MTVSSRKIRLLMELRAGGVIDTKVLSAIELTPRELFVENNFQDQAYDNNALPIGCGQTISQPLIVGLMTQALEVGDRMKVLEIGTGSGYQTAILSKLARRVYTMERHRPLLKQAEERFRQLRLHNITSLAGDGFKGWPEQAPF